MTLGHQMVVAGNQISGISLIAQQKSMAKFEISFSFDFVTHSPR